MDFSGVEIIGLLEIVFCKKVFFEDINSFDDEPCKNGNEYNAEEVAFDYVRGVWYYKLNSNAGNQQQYRPLEWTIAVMYHSLVGDALSSAGEPQ
jgi:hypothetical protein